MPLPQTESLHPAAIGLDQLPLAEAARIMAQAQAEAARVVEQAAPDITRAAEAIAAALSGGGRLVYAAAGSSALMTLADGVELPGTFGIGRDRIIILPAGGLQSLLTLEGATEDETDSARDALLSIGIGPGDCLVAVAASGATPYALAAAETGRQSGAVTVGIANNAGAPLFDRVDIPICLPTPAEVIAGSTRLGAGTAQKIALNLMSSLAAIRMGLVHDGMMVDVVADNLKLRERARRMVMQIANVDESTAADALERSHGAVKPAVLLSAGSADLETALETLAKHGGFLRPALAALGKQ
jgi:N-acetylmuramic acid 6-phosphate etherase